MPTIRPGRVVGGPLWPEPVEVKLAEEMGEYIRIVGATAVSGMHIDQIISRSELEKLTIRDSESAISG
jgi:hypothetical protein